MRTLPCQIETRMVLLEVKFNSTKPDRY